MTKNFNFDVLVNEIDQFQKKFKLKKIHKIKKEFIIESSYNWNNSNEKKLSNWLLTKRKKTNLSISKIKLSELRNWIIDKNLKSIDHVSKDFFRVIGVRVMNTNNREVKGWDQPFLEQIGFDGGILGLLRSKINGIPHYLLEAKEEPGNYKIVQLSPTVQATFANLKKAHKGKSVNYANLFYKKNNPKVIKLFEQWVSEDGGRLFNKRNKIILSEVENYKSIKLKKNFRWFTLWEINYLLKKNAFVSPHLRSFVAYMFSL
tara:strand:+ start:373 stop:1152 length:780 start_codon:yes stop_codon:yes gene_type:complete